MPFSRRSSLTSARFETKASAIALAPCRSMKTRNRTNQQEKPQAETSFNRNAAANCNARCEATETHCTTARDANDQRNKTLQLSPQHKRTEQHQGEDWTHLGAELVLAHGELRQRGVLLRSGAQSRKGERMNRGQAPTRKMHKREQLASEQFTVKHSTRKPPGHKRAGGSVNASKTGRDEGSQEQSTRTRAHGP